MTKTMLKRSLIAGLLLTVSACGVPAVHLAATPATMDAFARRTDATPYAMGAMIVPEEPDVVGDEGSMHTLASLPPGADLRRNMPPIADQGAFGSCTAFATIKGLREYMAIREGRPQALSARYAWWVGREYLDQKWKQNPPAKMQNTGLPTGLAVYTTKMFGTVAEETFPYPSLAEFAGMREFGSAKRQQVLHDWAAKAPIRGMEVEAKKWRIHQTVYTVGSVRGLRKALSEGRPVVIAARLFESFMSKDTAKTGMVPVPNLKKEKEVGGHAMMAVGYDNARQLIIVRNSWGADWGDNGYCYIPYAYFKLKSSDGRGIVRGGWTYRQ